MSNTETRFCVNLLYSAQVGTHTEFCVQHNSFPCLPRKLFLCPTQKLVSLTVLLTIHCTLTLSARSRRKPSKASTAVPSPNMAPLSHSRQFPSNTYMPTRRHQCHNIAADSPPTHNPQHPTNSNEREPRNVNKASTATPPHLCPGPRACSACQCVSGLTPA